MKTEVEARGAGRLVRIITAALLCGLVIPVSSSNAVTAPALDLKVRSPKPGKVELVRKNRSTAASADSFHFLPLVSTGRTPLEVWAHRPVPGGPAVAESIDRSSGSPVATAVPGLKVTLDRGLINFLRIRITDVKGEVVYEDTRPFCPNGIGSSEPASTSRSRGDDAVPLYPRSFYVDYCGEQQAESLVWLIRQGSPAYYNGTKPFNLPDGDYRYELMVNPDGVLPEKTLKNNRFVQRFRLSTDRGRWMKLTNARNPSADQVRLDPLRGRWNEALHPPEASDIDGPAGGLPDPAALLASKFSFDQSNGKDEISFSSIMANLGDAPIALYGSRKQSGSRTMPGWQFLKGADGKLIRHPINGFVWDQRDSHRHWHYNKLAVYELLSMDGKVLRRSGKVGFCFMPTTALRFQPVPGDFGLSAAPDFGFKNGLPINCGSRKSKRVAMSLPAGWGDEYYQSVAGQSLDVSDLSAGSYRLRITVNPEGDLAEVTDSNNVAERVIELGGRGDRRVLTVPRQGIASGEVHRLRVFKDQPGRPRVSSQGRTGFTPSLLCGLTPSR